MVYCQYIGISSGFLFRIVLLFVPGGEANAETIETSTVGPLLEILYRATSSRVGAICLLMFPLLCFMFACWAALTTSSRMTFAFIRDGGLPISRIFAAFNVITASSVVALGLSYAIYVAANIVRGRRKLPERAFTLPGWLGWTVIIGLVYTTMTTVLVLFPPTLPVDGTSMNYCVVLFATILLISVIRWFADDRHNFRDPRLVTFAQR
ncbi:uncharacterized protein BCR38DRAFT_496287 [Pseudomassariella vexata]|uniref:Amino acid permease/ SLC12A domain-containing protein n=1 Tax=Pseudomassariella vexata TaxID=1141098 RepID=A0A1Y2DN55_9PEZI|nr:uncharacterized protein BCR38DRAFT_496287 [Pseudomassariella vexata]ORY60680.1 hypothetical protein BCR38DRAFT_496287 [Pseudomassariella vexata]